MDNIQKLTKSPNYLLCGITHLSESRLNDTMTIVKCQVFYMSLVNITDLLVSVLLPQTLTMWPELGLTWPEARPHNLNSWCEHIAASSCPECEMCCHLLAILITSAVSKTGFFHWHKFLFNEVGKSYGEKSVVSLTSFPEQISPVTNFSPPENWQEVFANRQAIFRWREIFLGKICSGKDVYNNRELIIFVFITEWKIHGKIRT